MDTGWFGAIAGGASLIITAGAAAWIVLRKGNAEIESTSRNGVVEKWKEITDLLQKRSDAQEKDIEALRDEVTKLAVKLSAVEAQVVAREAELSALRTQITVRETERVEQRGTIHKLEKTVAAIQKPDPEKIAEALAPKIAEAMATTLPAQSEKPVPVQVIPATDPLPVEVKVVLPKGMAPLTKEGKA